MAQFDRLPEAERDLWLAKWQASRLECPDCGRPMAECSDPERDWYPYRRICYATMERAAAEAAVSALRGENANYHDGTFTDWVKARSSSHPYPAGAGEFINVSDRDLAPWDNFTRDLEASPVQQAEPDEAGDKRDGDHGPGVGLALPPDRGGNDEATDGEHDGEQVAEDQ